MAGQFFLSEPGAPCSLVSRYVFMLVIDRFIVYLSDGRFSLLNDRLPCCQEAEREGCGDAVAGF